MKKRLLALLLCLVMVIGLVPTVFAADGKVDVKICYLGGGSDYIKSYAQGETVAKPADPNKPGYTWNGKWYLSHTEPTATNAIAEKEWDFTWTIGPDARDGYLFPGYTENTYKVVFNANGGTGTMDDQTFTGGQTVDGGYVLLKKNTLTKEGQTFAGWTATVGSNTELYSDRCAVSVADFTENNGTYTLELTAKWEPVTHAADPITITYMLERGSKYSFTEEAQKDADYKIAKIPMTWPVPAGMKFDGKWKDVAGIEYVVDRDYKFTNNTTLYPVFVPDKDAKVYTVTYLCYDCGWTHEEEFNVKGDIATAVKIDPNGGKVSYKIGTAATTEITEKTTIFVTADTVLKGVKKTGYSFAGWKYDSSSLTFTAQWTKD